MNKKNKTVWYISKYANIQKYGADTRHSSFCKEFTKNNINVRLITSNSSHLYEKLPRGFNFFLNESYNGFHVTWLNVIKYKNSKSFIRFFSWLHFEFVVLLFAVLYRREKPQVIIVSSLSLFSVISGVILKKVFDAKLVFEVRDIWPQSLIEIQNLSSYHPVVILLRSIEKLGYHYSDEIVGTMSDLNKHVAIVLGRNKNVNYIPHGVDLDFYYNDQKKVDLQYLKLYIPENKFIVMYAGSFNSAYKLENLINCADSIGEDFAFLFIGDGPEKESLKENYKDYSNVHFLPKVPKNELQSILKCSDVLVHSFQRKNVFKYGVSPNKFIDYMFSEKPIVCLGDVVCPILSLSGAGEIINYGDYNTFKNRLLSLRSMTEAQRRNIGILGKEYIIKNLNYKILSEKYIRLFGFIED